MSSLPKNGRNSTLFLQYKCFVSYEAAGIFIIQVRYIARQVGNLREQIGAPSTVSSRLLRQGLSVLTWGSFVSDRLSSSRTQLPVSVKRLLQHLIED